MKCRSIESAGASATLYPPWTMRVQPHLPSRPLTAMVTSRSGAAFLACSAANRPAPPAPRMRTSVSSWFIARASVRRAEAGQDRVAPCRRVALHARIKRPAVRVHGDHEGAEALDAEAPQALRMQVVEVDVLDRLDPGGLE